MLVDWILNILMKPQIKKAQQLSSDVLTARSPQGSRFPVVSQRLRQTLTCSPILRPAQCKASMESWLSGSDLGMFMLCSYPVSDSILIIHDIRFLHIRGQALQIVVSILLGSPGCSQQLIFTAQISSYSPASVQWSLMFPWVEICCCYLMS